ncbi:MAG: recD, partial [Xanthomonadaceae bacterium]|nr:recD [Xanthomonadaceae bacterium]
GRAAARLADSVRAAAARLRGLDGVDATWCDGLPAAAKTLHRLLGTIPGGVQFRHGAADPLPFDVVVVDEASMIDLPLMCKLSEAVADGARLLLLGDRDQLPSIEAGDVLAAISDAAAGDATIGCAALPADIARTLAPLLGDVAVAAQPQPLLAGHRVHLQRGYRQVASLDLAPLAAAVRDGDAERALALLRGGLPGVTFQPDLEDPLAGPSRARLLDAWRGIANAGDPRAALVQAARVRLLTALRDGAQGAIALNARIEEALAGVRREVYFHGRLLLVQQNDYRQQLFNGDMGVCWRGDDGEIAVWFADGSDDGVRRVHPSALPAHDSAFAMTVHKAQGSEFDSVWLLLPRHDARTLSRELVYTAITRARCELHVCASEDAVRAALERHVVRVSGLQQRLQAVPRNEKQTSSIS